ncbi:hypothetical protein [Clostridium sp.]
MLNNFFSKLFNSEEIRTVEEDTYTITEEDKLDIEVADVFQRMQIGNL